ncbi:MAG: cobalamin-dependent protein [Pikeienuella sp.]
MLTRQTIFPESELPSGAEIVSDGRGMARDWRVVPGAYLNQRKQRSEADVKRRLAAEGHIGLHAQIGFRDLDRSRRAWVEIATHTNVERYGICLDWSMAAPRDRRARALRGTGLILNDVEDYVTLTGGAPVAPHFGDFVLGFPAAIENTQGALSAGATAIGNLGQYFTFRLPGHDDDIEDTRATLTALALIAAQEVEVLVHSNLDDGFAAQFRDLSSAIGAALLERYIVTDLIGATVSHCWGHHFSDPVGRMAFHLALAEVSDAPGTMIYANTTSYRGDEAENYAALAAYLSIDIAGQRMKPTGHAINPAPVTENQRIPDIDEIIAAQRFAARLIERTDIKMLDLSQPQALATRVAQGGRQFADRVLRGLDSIGVDTQDPFQMLLALRRIGGRRLEAEFGVPVAPSPIEAEIDEIATARMARLSAVERADFAAWSPRIVVATTDVHEHGLRVVERLLSESGADVIDGGISVDPEALAEIAVDADAIALSTYNGVALAFFEKLRAATNVPILIGGRLNQIPEGSNTSLPTDVTTALATKGAIVCDGAEDAIRKLLSTRGDQ